MQTMMKLQRTIIIANTPMKRIVGTLMKIVIPNAKDVVIDVVNIVVKDDEKALANLSSLVMNLLDFTCFKASVSMKTSSAPIPKIMKMPATCSTQNNLI